MTYCNDHGACPDSSDVCTCDAPWSTSPSLPSSLSCCILDDSSGDNFLGAPLDPRIVAGAAAGCLFLVAFVATFLGFPADLVSKVR